MSSESRNYTLVCHPPNNERFDIWHSSNPLNNPNSLFLMQYSLIAIVSQCVNLFLKPLGQSSIVSRILVSFLYPIYFTTLFYSLYNINIFFKRLKKDKKFID